MTQTFKTTIKGFDYPLFTIACASNENLQSLNISPQLGIRCQDFIHKCETLFAAFLIDHEYTQADVESYFGVKFCFLQIQKKKIWSFQGLPLIGSNVIYVHKRLVLS